MMTELLLNVST